MDYEELDEAEREKRKQEKIKWQAKKRASTLFMICTSVFEILITLIVILLLFVLSAFLVFRVFNANGETGQLVFEILSIIIFIGGMILGYFLYKIIARASIKKFHLEDKLLDEVLLHYKKLTKEEKEAAKLSGMKR